MKDRVQDLMFPLFLTIGLILILNIISTAIIPLWGTNAFAIPFNILVILYLGLRIHTVWLPFLILVIQLFYSIFTVEGWEIGTIAGIIICATIAYLRDLINLSSALLTVITVQIFQIFWFLVSSSLLYLKSNDFIFIIDKFWRFIPESILISIISPIIFFLLDKLWRKRRGLGDEEDV